MPVELDRLVRVERVDASTTPVRNLWRENRLDAIPQLQSLELQAIEQPRPKQHALEERGPAGFWQPSSHGIGRQAVVERAVQDELHELLQIQAVGRHAQHDPRRGARRIADCVGMADGAIETDLIDAEAPPPGQTDWEVFARLEYEAK